MMYIRYVCIGISPNTQFFIPLVPYKFLADLSHNPSFLGQIPLLPCKILAEKKRVYE